jgi:hypothetical protein
MDTEVQFVGKVEEKTFNNGGSILTAVAFDKDKAALCKRIYQSRYRQKQSR